MKRIYNLKINRIDPSKLKLKSFEKTNIPILPNLVDLRSEMPDVFDQGNLGSCTANAIASCFQLQDTLDDRKSFIPSRLFIYYNERKMEHSVKEDSGAQISDGIKSLEEFGVCPETLWPYDISKFTKKPLKECYKTAEKHKAINVNNIQQDLTSMKTCLANGFPFVVGIAVYKSFETEEVAKTGKVPLPDVNKEECLGGHAVLVVGYNDNQKTWLVRNSWGTSWGMGGYFTLPYMYLLDSNLSSDLWNITKVSPSK